MISARGSDPETLSDDVACLQSALASARSALETAKAQERSRIAEDLHDILGHALEVVAFKAELAARRLSADPDQARREMVDIQRVARAAMTDVRTLVRCRRATDLPAELAHALSLFGSADVQVSVDGDVRAVSERARDPLARVLREAVTNVLRHATPTRCRIALGQHDRTASLEVVNDGAADPVTRRASSGTGLLGLTRLLTEHGGCLDAGRSAPGCFTLRATIATPAVRCGDRVSSPQPRGDGRSTAGLPVSA